MQFSRYIVVKAFALTVRFEDSNFNIFHPLLRNTDVISFSLKFKLRSLSSSEKCSGIHLLSHTVSSIVPSADRVLTIVFEMGTGVSPGRIDTAKF